MLIKFLKIFIGLLSKIVKFYELSIKFNRIRSKVQGTVSKFAKVYKLYARIRLTPFSSVTYAHKHP